MHSRLGPRTSIHSRLGPHSDNQHEQPSKQSVHSRLGPQEHLPSHRSHDGWREVTQSCSSSTISQRNPSPVRNPPHAPLPRHRRADHVEEQPRPIGQNWGQPRAPLPQQRQIQEEVERLLNKRSRDFQRKEVADEALRRDMINIGRSPFTDEIEQAEPPRKFSMPHFISFKGDEDPERHLKHYRKRNDPLSKQRRSHVQGYSPPLYKARRKIGSTPYRHNLSGVLTNFLWFSPKKIHHIAQSRRSPTTCSTSRRTQRSRSMTM